MDLCWTCIKVSFALICTGSGRKLCQFCFSVPLTATRGQISKPLRWHVYRRDVDASEIMKLCSWMQTVSNVSPSSLSADLQSLVNIMSSAVCDNGSRPPRHQQLCARYLHPSTLHHCLNIGTVLQFSFGFRFHMSPGGSISPDSPLKYLNIC